tara:strand:+ start:2688 stop:2969 length:282 start_codon:yes stop_codon:yes gene_type:complete
VSLTLDKMATIQGRLFDLFAVVEDIEASVSTAMRELEIATPITPSDMSPLELMARISLQIEIFCRVFTEIESSVSHTLDISSHIECDLKEMGE